MHALFVHGMASPGKCMRSTELQGLHAFPALWGFPISIRVISRDSPVMMCYEGTTLGMHRISALLYLVLDARN